MKTSLKYKGLAAAAVLALSALPTHAAPDDALIDALVQKGVISQKEAADIRDKTLTDLNTPQSAQVINFSSAIKNLTLYGDVRLRAEYRGGQYDGGELVGTPAPSTTTTAASAVYKNGGTESRERLRYRVRLGLNGDLYDNFFFGVGVSTGSVNRSGNVTFGSGSEAVSTSGSATTGTGPFGKNSGSTLAINKVFLGWRPIDELTLEVGQFDNPFYFTNLSWSGDINPYGFAEQYKQDFCNFELFANAGQFVYDATSFNDTGAQAGGAFNTNYSDVYLLEEQIGGKFNFNKDTFVKAAVGITSYTGTRTSTASSASELTGSNATVGNLPNGGYTGPFLGAGPDGFTNNYGVNNLLVLDAPAEFDFKIDKVPIKLFADVSVNLDAQGRSNAAQNAVKGGTASQLYAAESSTYNAATAAAVLATPEVKALNRNNSGQDLAYEVGAQAGVLKDKGDWMAKVYWLARDYYSVDTNLLDSDIFDGSTNLQGVVVSGSYNFTKGLTGTVQYGQAFRVDNQLATPGFGQDLNLGSVDHFQIVQADVTWKF